MKIKKSKNLPIEDKDEKLPKSILFGEVDLEHSHIKGSLDCRGTEIRSAKDSKALNLRFAKIDNSLFINRGFAFDGQIDLSNTELKNLFLRIPKGRRKKSPLLLIGARYSYVDYDKPVTDNQVTSRKAPRINNFASIKARWTNVFAFRSARWIHLDRGANNFRQPYEQFAKALIHNGEAARARDVLVLFRPLRYWWEKLAWGIVQGFYFLGMRVYLCFLSLIGVWFLGGVFFEYLYYNLGYLRVSTNPYRPTIDTFELSFQRLLPILNIGSSGDYYLEPFTPWYWQACYYVHAILGTTLLAMLIINIARTRKGSN
ncbi:MAG: hypothetical protein AAFX53_18915 [Bacteroidota bacterium]